MCAILDRIRRPAPARCSCTQRSRATPWGQQPQRV